MNISNLKVGMEVKNYKELCNLLDEKVKVGKAKILQLQDFERYFTYEKQGNKFIITKILDEIKEKVDMRTQGKSANNNIFADDFRTLMIFLMNNEPSGCFELPKNLLGKSLSLLNQNYLDARDKVNKLSEITGVHQEQIYEFYDNNSKKITETIERNLNRCRREALLMHERIMCVHSIEVSIQTNELNKPMIDENGKVVYHTETISREATEEERKMILRFEKEVMKELNVSDLKDAFLKGKYWELRKRVSKKLVENLTGIQYYYEAYRITWDKDIVEEEYNKLKDKSTENDLLTNLNNNMMKSIMRSTKARNTKATNVDILEVNPYKLKEIELRTLENYIKDQETLTKVLIDKNAKSLKSELKKDVNLTKFREVNKSINQEEEEFNSAVPF